MKKFEDQQYPLSNLTEKLIKISFDVFNQLGYGLPERVYQKAFAVELTRHHLEFKRECYGKIDFNGVIVGKYFIDFLVEDKVAVELKVRNEIYQTHINQLLNYIKAQNLAVGLLLAFSKGGVKIKRLVNTICVNQRDRSA
ncbi:MAG: GxxExxY protein [Patescibacteria group bacterium]|jgi:GxxExxY protein